MSAWHAGRHRSVPERYPKLVGHCRAPGCGIKMMSSSRWAETAPSQREGWGRHSGSGYCRTHYGRFKKYGDPLAEHPTRVARRKREAKPPKIETCQQCERKMVDRRRRRELPKDADVITKGARGLCRTCYNELRESGDFELQRFTLERDIVLDDWVMMRDDGHTDLDIAARRIGMTRRALEQALYRARRRGDPRGSLVPYAHDMRRDAA